MEKSLTKRKFDLEERTLSFSKGIVRVVKNLPLNIYNKRLTDQLVRSATSVGANYIEANDSLGKRDFLLRLRIARKEAKETVCWLNIISDSNCDLEERIAPLIQEAQELKNILSTIIINSE